jgi:hypothetical protein
MAKVMNIGVLDVVDIKEELAKEITELQNIGLLIESDKSQALLGNCKKTNIGFTLKMSSDAKIILKDGEVKLDNDFLTGLLDPVIFLVNGNMIIKGDVDIKLFDEKVYKILLNGVLECPKKLKGIVELKSTINGMTNYYSSDYKYFSNNVRLNNRFLKGLKANSKLSFNTLMIVDEIDLNLFREKISNIEILNKLILLDEYEDNILEYVNDYYEVNLVIIPKGKNGIKYFDKDIRIDDNFIKKLDNDVLYVDGDVEIYLKEDLEINKYIKYLISDSVICNEKCFTQINDILADDVKVEIIEGKLIKNNGKMNLSPEFDEKVTIKNMGKIVIDEDVNENNFNEMVSEIINYGAIAVSKDKMSLVKNKVNKNYGNVKELIREEEEDKENLDEDVLYNSIGELKL